METDNLKYYDPFAPEPFLFTRLADLPNTFIDPWYHTENKRYSKSNSIKPKNKNKTKLGRKANLKNRKRK